VTGGVRDGAGEKRRGRKGGGIDRRPVVTREKGRSDVGSVDRGEKKMEERRQQRRETVGESQRRVQRRREKSAREEASAAA
jgi:hypothetical protein